MNKSRVILLLIFVIASAHGSDCNRRGCTPPDDPSSLEYAKNRLETVVNSYFNQMMTDSKLSATEMQDRHNKIVLWAKANSGNPPAYLLDAWEAELSMKVRLLSAGDSQFANGPPTVVQSAIDNYYEVKAESSQN